MARYIETKDDIEHSPDVDLSKCHFDGYILGGLLVKVSASNLENAQRIAKQYARNEVEKKAGNNYQFLQIQDPKPAEAPAEIEIDGTPRRNNGQFEATTIEAQLDAIGYRRSTFGDKHTFSRPAIVGNQADAQIGTVESILSGEQVSPFRDRSYSKSVVGKAVAPTRAKAEAGAQNDAYRQFRAFLKDKGDAFILVTEPGTLAGILEVKEEYRNQTTLEKIFNVYGYKRASKIFDAPVRARAGEPDDHGDEADVEAPEEPEDEA